MATLEQLQDALSNADKAGDAAAARTLADEIVRMRSAAPVDTPEIPSPQPAKEGPSMLDVAKEYFAATPLGMPQRFGDIAAKFIVENGPDIASGVLQSAKDAYSAPYRAYTGDLPMTDDSGRTSEQAISEAFNLAQWISPSSPAQGTLPKIQREWEAANPQPLTEGQKVAEAASRIGVDIPRAVASDNVTVQNVGKKLSQTPIVGTPLRNASKTATEQLDEAARQVQDDLGTGSVEVAGNRIRQDLTKFATDVEPKEIKALYDKVDNLVDPRVRIQMSETAKVAAKIKADRIRAKASDSRAVEQLIPALTDRTGRSYEELKVLREDFRRLKSNKGAMENLGMDERHVNALYSALSSDLKAAAKAAGGDEGLKAFNEANNRAFVFSRDKDVLRNVLGQGSDENAASKLAALASDTSRANIKGLMLVKSKVSKETWNELAGSVVDDLAWNPTNGQFTPDKFVTKWNKLSESGKKLLFAPEQRQALEDIAKVSSRFKQMNEFANPSGTGGAVALMAGGGTAIYGALADPMVLSGTVLTAATGRGISSYLAKPASAKAVADYAKAYELAAKTPSQSTQNLLASKAMALARIAANGNERAASNIAARLSSVQNAAADEGNDEQIGRPEGNPEPAKADKQFNDAYLQGRAL